ncbi:MAG TPA: hypothetical protein VFL27_03135 [Candidatus Dormibacteraeota bacterium]|nr:hypothetical protein [Candidatus Dormibacteraeota bacterium]
MKAVRVWALLAAGSAAIALLCTIPFWLDAMGWSSAVMGYFAWVPMLVALGNLANLVAIAALVLAVLKRFAAHTIAWALTGAACLMSLPLFYVMALGSAGRAFALVAMASALAGAGFAAAAAIAARRRRPSPEVAA